MHSHHSEIIRSHLKTKPDQRRRQAPPPPGVLSPTDLRRIVAEMLG